MLYGANSSQVGLAWSGMSGGASYRGMRAQRWHSRLSVDNR